MHSNDLQFLKQRGFADLPMMRIFRFSVPDLLQQKRAMMRCLEALPPIHLSPFWANVLFGSS
jgi:hypothetical protein